MLNSRREHLLRLIVENYIETAEPVGSQFLVEEGSLQVSGATLRNEMRALEDDGYLTHPHTSSGRTPTEQGFQYYVVHIMAEIDIDKTIQQKVQDAVSEGTDQREQVKCLAKFAAEHLTNAIIVAFNPSSVYYTGISYLFAQPEFRDSSYTVSISKIFDHCEDRLDEIYDLVNDGQTEVLIGNQNPFGSSCGLVGTRVRDIIFIVLAPMRMDYGKAVGLLKYINSAK